MSIGPIGVRLRPLAAYALLALVVSAGLARLGFWQLERAQQKQHMLDAIDSASAEQAVALTDALQTGESLLFRAVRARGQLLGERQILLDNQIRDGVPGVQVFVPMKLQGSEKIVLVDRGWLPWRDRAQSLPGIPVSDGTMTLDGILLTPPAAGLALGGEIAQQWPLLVTRIDMPELERHLQLPLLDLVLEDRATPRGQSLRAGMLPPERHRGYALQWFGLSLTILIIFGVLATRSWRAGRTTQP